MPNIKCQFTAQLYDLQCTNIPCRYNFLTNPFVKSKCISLTSLLIFIGLWCYQQCHFVKSKFRISTKLTFKEQNFICLLSSPFCMIFTKNILHQSLNNGSIYYNDVNHIKFNLKVQVFCQVIVEFMIFTFYLTGIYSLN